MGWVLCCCCSQCDRSVELAHELYPYQERRRQKLLMRTRDEDGQGSQHQCEPANGQLDRRGGLLHTSLSASSGESRRDTIACVFTDLTPRRGDTAAHSSHTHTYTHVYMHTHTHTNICTFMYIYTRVHTHACTHIHVCICTYMGVYTCIHINTHVYAGK